MQGFLQQNNSLIWTLNHETVQIEPWGRDSLRVRATISAGLRDDLLSVLLPPAETDAQITIGAEGATIRNGALTASVSPEGLIRFSNTASSTELLAEEQPVRATRLPPRSFKAVHSDLFHLEVRFRAYEDERFYGLGQHQHGLLDQKGCTIDLVQRNTEVSIPFLFSSRGYGFLWHNPGIGRVELGYNTTRWVAEATPQLDYWITAGATSAEIMEHYADATGHPSEFPEWAAGFWQSKLRYRTQDELLTVAHEYKRRGLPLSVIVIDFFHWTHLGEWRFDPAEWPDPAAMVRELDELGVQLMVSVWPSVSPVSENHQPMLDQGLFIGTEYGPVAHADWPDKGLGARSAQVAFYDATNPDARAYVWERIRRGYHELGIKVFWLDASEPELKPGHQNGLRYHAGPGLEVGNLYPRENARMVHDGLRAAGEREIISLNRSSWAGAQRYGAALWSGDIDTDFASLRTQIKAGLNVMMSGIPWWTTDIGGFHGGDPDDPGYRELLVRWFQYGTFCPLFRLHGFRGHGRILEPGMSGLPNEVWS